jgi:DNA polymerase III alpha subunit
MGITDICPIRFGLLFERFLNPERVSPPDVDIDFCQSRRVEVIDYVRKKYGERCVSHIITYGTLGAKSVIRDVARVMGIAYSEADRIASKRSSPARPSCASSSSRAPAIASCGNMPLNLKVLPATWESTPRASSSATKRSTSTSR